ncbi:MAG: alpha/beta fold hydrolase [Pseudomonas sp.]|uniref:alpha/beta fold hydrolase n=1 Tax=Pseudomonas sp. TaxID=306 RepID=UPI00339B0D3F
MSPSPLTCACPAAQIQYIQGDGLQLATYRWGNPGGATLLLVHGYPDSHQVWLPLVAELAADFQLIAYDVRGFGASDKPDAVHAYRLEHLANDLEAVIRTLCPDQAVHLIAHDWGSIQAWEALTEPRIQPLLRSFTSLSGPCLDHVGTWLRERLGQPSWRAWGQVGRQLRRSWYIGLFHLPLLPRLLWGAGSARRWSALLTRMEGIQPPPTGTSLASDGRHGVKLYRANMLRCLLRPRRRSTPVPVQLIVANRDRFVDPALFDSLAQWAPQLCRYEAAAGHWQLLAEPVALANWLRGFVALHEPQG